MKYFITFITLAFLGSLTAQTNISGGNVFGKWTKSGSPYRINGNITIPKDSTLRIEPGVSVQFGPRKQLNVNGRILALGNAKSTDSIWFTRQNTNDTNYWRGIKFINTSNSNDTSIFKHCVFNNCKNPYDTAWLNKGGCITLFGYGKLKVLYSSFYKNGSGDGGCLLISDNSFARIHACTFKNNAANVFYRWDGTFYQPIAGTRGSAMYIRNNSNCFIDSCNFKNNSRGLQFKPQPSINYEATTVYVDGNSYLNQKCFATITNSIFDGNEGIMLLANDRAIVNVNNCSFINAPKDKSLNVILSHNKAEVFSRNCSFYHNASSIIIFAHGGKVFSFNDLMSNNDNFGHLYYSKYNNSTGYFPYISLNSTKVLNNKAIILQSSAYSGLVLVEDVVGCLFANNECPTFLSFEKMYNSTIVNNYCASILLTCESLAYEYKNNIVWGNKTDSVNGRQIAVKVGSSVMFRNNLIENDSNNFRLKENTNYIRTRGMPTVYTGNFSANPQFVNPTAGYGVNFNAANADFSLKSSCSLQSLAINAGHKDTVLIGLPRKDLAGNTRFFEDKIDLGAYENTSGSPEIRIIKQTLKDSFCEKSRAALLTVSAIGKGLAYQWQQSVNAGNSWSNISNETSHQLTKANTNASQNNTIYRTLLTGTCDVDTSQTMQIVTFDLPQVNLGKDTAVCYASVINKQSNISGTYLWHTSKTTNNISQTIVKDSLWWLQVTNSKGCKNRDSIKISNVFYPIVNLGADRAIYKDEELTLDAGSGASTYLWNNGLNTPTRTFKGQDLGETGQYQLWVDVGNSIGCITRDSIKISVLGFSSLAAVNKEHIILYPNPSNNFLNIELPIEQLDKNSYLEIKTIDGKTIKHTEIKDTKTILSVEELKSGVYFLEFHLNTKTVLLKWIKN